MPDKEKIIKGIEYCIGNKPCYECPYKNYIICEKQLKYDILSWMKNEEERYATMVISWLTEIAMNNAYARQEMPYIDAIEDIRARASYRLKQYFIDKQKGQE
jgi:hypothetical protein